MANSGGQKNYYGHIDLACVNSSHTQAFFFLREHCETRNIERPRALEIGCSHGYFSRALREHGVHVYGVEPFSAEALDSGAVDEFFHGTVEDFCRKAPQALRQSFDAVILGDVLEHLVDPEEILVALGAFLKDDGVVIASVPNVTHIGIRRMLEDGDWACRKFGILDATHLRFFSWRGLRELFIRAGFGIERRYQVLLPEVEVHPSEESCIRALLSLPLNAKDHCFQFVVRASRRALAQESFSDSLPARILLLSPRVDSTLTRLRLIDPLSAYLAKRGGSLQTGGIGSDEQLDWADVLIMHREVYPAQLNTLRRARERGLAVLYDTDDLLTQLPPWSKALAAPLGATLLRQVAATADRVTCASEHLKSELLKETDKVFLVPNVVAGPEKPPQWELKHGDGPCTLVIASSDEVPVDMLLQPLREVLAALPELGLLVIGPVAAAFGEFEARMKRHPACSVKLFDRLLLRIDNGIGLIPLDDSLFSSCKSPIKYYHYASCGIVSIASALPPYADCVEHGQNGLLADNSPQSWSLAILRLARDPALRCRLLAGALRAWQEKASMEVAVAAWERAFANLPRPMARSVSASASTKGLAAR